MANDPNSEMTLIARRKAELEASRAREKAERARLDAEAEARAKEEEELAIAERVLARLRNDSASLPASASSSTGVPTPKLIATISDFKLAAFANDPPFKAPASGGASRPGGIPTVPQMVALLLSEAQQRGLKGLNSGQIMKGINDRWWPGVSVNLIMPTVYRCIARKYWFAKEGKLVVLRPDSQPSRRVGGGADLLKFSS